MLILQLYRLEKRIVCITTDNALVNNFMAQKIEVLVPMSTACTNAIGCMAHKIHLAAQDGLNALAQGPPVATNEPKGNMNGPMSISHISDLPDGINTSYNSNINQISRLSSYI
ncbi:hypothetical protein O181_019558 [Austropuccinia psidii MF-1]|uniref:Uncharacterized protein n=1 Tax=Austropuccinia psidii MF-1 TaxID=1389203 RepID=A0A9Q3GTQ0_9BASI|nr:hypothetical protein [Austropuccinia psidii MF-1]